VQTVVAMRKQQLSVRLDMALQSLPVLILQVAVAVQSIANGEMGLPTAIY